MEPMKIAPLFLALILITVLTAGAQTVDLRKAPKPGSYPDRERYKGKLAKVILDSKRARLFRTVYVREQKRAQTSRVITPP